jgi:hypothetical protein
MYPKVSMLLTPQELESGCTGFLCLQGELCLREVDDALRDRKSNLFLVAKS